MGVWDNSFASTLQYTNPPRRDVAMLPAPAGPPGGGPPPSGGWLVIAFLTDNPGAWLMHCHIVRTLSFVYFFAGSYRLEEEPKADDYEIGMACRRRSRCTVLRARERDFRLDVFEYS